VTNLSTTEDDADALSSGERLPKIYKALEMLRMDHGAFSQLTRRYMMEDFNPRTPDKEGVR
jgi:triacylglycerol lipase